MCGIAGIFHKNEKPVELSTVQTLTRTLTHRGPDDEGYYTIGSVGLGQRRLSIIDLSPGGHQPMTSPDGRYTITFNGEIYNYRELAHELKSRGVVLKTQSDTEVLLQLLILEGKKALGKLNGMFAFVLWDNLEKKIFAARDRLGKKPFYYWNTDKFFIFGSELKAIVAHPAFSKKIDPVALQHFLFFEYIPSPLCILEGVQKLPAGHFLVVNAKNFLIQKYWDIPFLSSSSSLSSSLPLEGGGIKGEGENVAEAKSTIITLLDQATERRLVSDVPLGVFLSGGIDSSAIVAMMSRHRSGKDIRTFSIGFEEKSYDESAYALKVANLFHTQHTHHTFSEKNLLEVLPEVTHFLDEPFADYSIIPTYLLSKMTREHVTVALGGDGGDELFAGYPTFDASNKATLFSRFPKWAQNLAHFISRKIPVSHSNMSLDFKARHFLKAATQSSLSRHPLWLSAFSFDQQKELFNNNFQAQLSDPLETALKAIKDLNTTDENKILSFYKKFYLSEDILFKTDRASMAASLEVRAPFLDVNFVEYVSQLPYSYKLNGTTSKYILKKALEDFLPKEILYRKKKGFGVPLAQWLCGPLKQKMLDTLNPEKIKREGFFNPDFITQLTNEHLGKKANHRKLLFTLLMFEWWMEKWM